MGENESHGTQVATLPGRYSCHCGARWPGVSRCHCAGCHQTFGGIGLFDRHRRDVKGVGTCVDPATIVSLKTGERELYLTFGIWRSIESPAPAFRNVPKVSR